MNQEGGWGFTPSIALPCAGSTPKPPSAAEHPSEPGGIRVYQGSRSTPFFQCCLSYHRMDVYHEQAPARRDGRPPTRNNI